MIWLGPTAASYALDTLFLGLFARAGTIQSLVPEAYGIGSFVLCGSLYVVFAKGWSQRFRDPGLVSVHALLALALQLMVVALGPQIAFPYLANVFTVFAFAMIWLPIGESVLVWLAGVFATGLLFYGVGDRFGIPTGTPSEMILVWLYFALTLGRCVVLSIHASGMRERLFKSRRSLRASVEQIQQLVRYDELTKLLNRRSLLEQLQLERSRADRTDIGFSIALFDIDHFKRVNDNHGHAAGDEVLTELRLRVAIAAKDWNAVVPGLALTVSAGVARYRKSETIEQLISRADIALYQAKGAGRNQVRCG